MYYVQVLLRKLLSKSSEKSKKLEKWRLKADFSKPHPLHEGLLNYQVDLPTFQSMCSYFTNMKIGERNSLLALHATPGLGKSSLLDHFCKLITDWKHTGTKHEAIAKAPDWLFDAIFVTVSFNFKSQQTRKEYAHYI